MSIASNFPAIKPTLLLDFANTEELDSRVTFTRASTATYYGTQTAKAEENLLVQSQDFTTTWDMSNGVTSTANTAVAPDGTTTADTLAETATTSIHTAVQNAVSSGVVTVSVFAKANSGTPFLTIGVSKDASNYSSATFDLSAGTNTQTQATGTYSSASATVAAASQGFYRCTLTVTTDSLSSVRIGLNNTSTPTANNRGFGVTYLGVVTNSIFLWGAQLEQRSAVSAYTATTTQPITNYIPVLQTAASGVARFEHNPTTFESLGLEIEEQRTNLLTYSEQFNDATWTKSASSITANTVVSPDGTLNADKLVEDATSAAHFVRQNFTSTVGVTYVSSIYLKAAERTSAFVIHYDGSVFAGVSVNLSTGALSAPPVPTGLTDASATSTITSVGNGWYRVSVSRAQVSTTTTQLRVALQNGSNDVYTGDGTSGIYIWGAQLEAGAFATSYIPTVASQVTRAADAASMTGTNFSSWYNAAEGTLYADFARASPSANSFVAAINDNTFAECLVIYTNGAPNMAAVVRSQSANQSALVLVTGAGLSNTQYKQTLAYKANDFAACSNAASPLTDSSGTVPVVNRLNIGNLDSATQFLNGTIRKISYYPIRVSNTNLQALTS